MFPPERSESACGDVETDDIRRLRAEYTAAIGALRSAVLDTTRLTRLFSILNEPAPLPELLDQVLSTLSELFVADIVVLLDRIGTDRFQPLAAIGLPIHTDRALGRVDDVHASAAWRGSAPVAVSKVQDDATVAAYLREQGAEAIIWLPVTGDQVERGVLVLARCRPLAFARADIDLVRVMAYRIGQILDRAHADRERDEVEARLREADKAESLARMASAIAHHFNNMLAVVVGSLDLAMEEMPFGCSGRNDLLRAKEAAQRAAKTSGLMLAYVGQGAGARELIDLPRLTADAIETLRGVLPANVEVTTELSSPDLVVLATAAQVTQAISNLLVNATEAIGEGTGLIHVAVRAIPAAEISTAHVRPANAKPTCDAYACLEVSDSGCGIAPAMIDKIFDPFFSTKFLGRGLGLPVILGTIRSHGGFIGVESSIGHGTTVRIYLPLASSTTAVAPTRPAAATVPVAGGAVLLADDEDLVRHTAERALMKFGYEVFSAMDGVEAVELFRARQSSVAAVILDVTMPRMDGWAALSAIRSLQPHVPVIMASGYNESQLMRGRLVEGPLFFLHKPFDLDQLRAALEKAVAAGVTPARDR